MKQRLCRHHRQRRCVCADNRSMECSGLMTLSELKTNLKARVVRIKMERLSELHEIIAMGVLPGVEIVLTQKFPSYVFRIGQSRFAIDRELARDIEVKYCG